MSDVPEFLVPVELIQQTEHHGPYIVNSYGKTVCDFYAMSNPNMLSTLNGGPSYPINFCEELAPEYASYFVTAVNSHAPLTECVKVLREALEALEKDAARLITGRYVIEQKTVEAAKSALSRAKELVP